MRFALLSLSLIAILSSCATSEHTQHMRNRSYDQRQADRENEAKLDNYMHDATYGGSAEEKNYKKMQSATKRANE